MLLINYHQIHYLKQLQINQLRILKIRRHFLNNKLFVSGICKMKNMIHNAYICDLDEIRSLDGWQNWEINYEVTKNNIVKCNHGVSLYGLCFYLYSKIDPKQYSMIEASQIQIGEQDMQQAVYFLNRVACKYLDWVKEDYQAQFILDYMRNVLRNYDVKMIIKFEQDIVEPSHANKNEAIYVIIYYFSEQTQNKIMQFAFQKFHIFSDEVKTKIQMLGVLNPSETQINIYGLNPEKQKVCTKVIKINEREQENNNSSNGINSSKSQNKSIMQSHNEYLIVFGSRQPTKLFMKRLEQQVEAIKIKVFKKGNEVFNNYLFAVIRMMTEKYKKCKIVMNQKNEAINVYYHESIKDIFDAEIMGYEKYKIVKTKEVKYALKDATIGSIKDKISNLMVFEDKAQGQMIIGDRQIVECLEGISEKKNIQTKLQKKGQIAKQNPSKQGDKKQDYILQFINNIEINDDNLKQLIDVCALIKVQQYMTFKIDIGNYIRISNRVKKSKVVYLVFQYYSQILQLQSVIQDTISIKQLNQCFHKSKKIVSENGELTIKLYPSTQQMWKDKEKFFQQIVNQLKEDKDEIFRSIVCTVNILYEILTAVNIEFIVTFIINQQIPMIQCDQLLDKQTQKSRLLTGKSQLDFYSQIKAEVINKEFRNSQTCKKDEDALKEIMQKNIHEYEVGDFILSELDEYNISFMIAEGLKNMYLILSKQPMAEYVYLTYHQKLVKVIRDKFGNFATLQEASMGKDLNRAAQIAIRPALQRAFLTGQKYVAINLPFQHVKLMSLSNINRLPIGNHSLVKYYLRKMNESERYKIKIKAPFTLQYFQNKFAKTYKLKFQNKQLKKQIKALDFGYGNIRKEREKPFVCLVANYQICEKVLRKFELDYENKQKQNKK